MIEAILFDLDKTLYPADAGLQEAGDRQITRCISQRLGLGPEAADALRVRLWNDYGTTARGLEVEFGLPPRWMYSCAIDTLEPALYVRPDPELAAMLGRLPHRHCILTNSTAVYAEKVLNALAIGEFIDCVFDIEAVGWVGKPNRSAYLRALEGMGLEGPQVLLVEDTAHNIPPATALGIATVLVGETGEADYMIPAITDLEAVLADLEREGLPLGAGRNRSER